MLPNNPADVRGNQRSDHAHDLCQPASKASETLTGLLYLGRVTRCGTFRILRADVVGAGGAGGAPVSGASRVGAAARRAAARLVPAGGGTAGDGRVARFLRVGGYVAILALIAAKATVEQLTFAQPRGGLVLRLYRLISGGGFGQGWPPEIIFLAVMALYAVAILWMTSRRSGVAPATLAIGTGAGVVLGVVMYTVAPLGLTVATNPWLPGSDVTPFVVLAWILLFGAPVAAAIAADRRYAASGGPPRPRPAAGPARSWRRGSSPTWSARCSSPFWAPARSR